MEFNAQRVKLYVELHIKKIKTVRDVSRKLRIPYDILRKEFLRTERKPLGDFILMTKIRVIKEHLQMHDAPCYRICKEYGLRDDTGAKVFKRITGVTMLEYRKKHRRGDSKPQRSKLPAKFRLKSRLKPGPKPRRRKRSS
ncbi:MAG: hypothetical protein KBF97_00125 [Bacteroidetes bacterium]|nr:hypothetical protein [Bacteroidota bacterium]